MFPMFWLPYVLPVIVVVLVGVLAIYQYRQHLKDGLDRFENWGDRVKRHKDSWLLRVIDFLPVPAWVLAATADVLSISRLPCIVWSIHLYEHGQTVDAFGWFTAGWLTDLFDGPVAKAAERRRGYPTRHGKILDVTIDLLVFGWMAFKVAERFPDWLVWAFGLTVILRATYGGYLLIRMLWFPRWPLGFLSESLAGRYKTVFVVLAFGLIFGWPHSAQIQQSATAIFAFATLLEYGSLWQQTRRAIRVLRHPVLLPGSKILPFPRAGNE